LLLILDICSGKYLFLMTVITKKSTKAGIAKALKSIKPKKSGVDMKRFSGKLHWKGDALKVQQEMRNE
jgi:hypothetical protein